MTGNDEIQWINEEATMSEMRRQSVVDEIDVAVAEAIQACGGDAREAVAQLIRAQWAMDNERRATVSAGYVRRRPA